METPAKKMRMDTDVVSGYIHSISALKFTTKNRGFFNAVLQTGREEFHDVTIFSPRKRALFSQASDNGTAIRLTHVRKALSFKGTSDFDVMGNQLTELSVTKVTFPFRKPAAPVRQTLVDVTALPAGKKVPLVKAKVVAASLQKTVSIRGSDKEVKRFTVFDGTAQMSLCVWERLIHDVEVDSSYVFTELSTRVFEGKVELTTTVESMIEKICDLDVGDADAVQEEESVVTVKASICGAEIKASLKCALCGSRQDTWDSQSRFARCQSCRMLQKSGAFSKVLRGTLKVKNDDGADYTLTVGHCTLVDYLKRRNITSLMDKEEAIEEHLLFEECLQFSFDDECNVSSIVDIADSAVPSSS
ncbi:uncharacterized protein [Paramormyrops kingsleyae]|uniref:uncharacterized protein n=1 Tax=Paramormyrops kingsleyae TaxID=1676925 RepID=UPI003B96ADCD